jgi:hypothetical protein
VSRALWMHLRQSFNIYLGCSSRTHPNLLLNGARCSMSQSGGNPHFCGMLQSHTSRSQTYMLLCASRSVPSTMCRSGSRISSRNYASSGPSHPMILHCCPPPLSSPSLRHVNYSATSWFTMCQGCSGVTTSHVAGLTPIEGRYVIV